MSDADSVKPPLSPPQLKEELNKLHRRLILAVDAMTSQSEVLSYITDGPGLNIDLTNRAEVVLTTLLNSMDVSGLVKTAAEAYYDAWTTICETADEARAVLKASDQHAAIREAQIDAVNA